MMPWRRSVTVSPPSVPGFIRRRWLLSIAPFRSAVRSRRGWSSRGGSRWRPATCRLRWKPIPALEREPANISALNGLGVAEDLQRRHAEAQAHYREALRLAPNDWGIRNNLAL